MSTETTIKVVCKFRPLNSLEKEMGGETCIELKGDTVVLLVASTLIPAFRPFSPRYNIYL